MTIYPTISALDILPWKFSHRYSALNCSYIYSALDIEACIFIHGYSALDIL